MLRLVQGAVLSKCLNLVANNLNNCLNKVYLTGILSSLAFMDQALEPVLI